MSPIAKLFLAGGGVGFTYYLFMRQYWYPNPYKTRAVENIEGRFSAGGATPTHTPAVATERGTLPLSLTYAVEVSRLTLLEIGSTTNNEPRKADGYKGPDSEHFRNNVADQKKDVRRSIFQCMHLDC